jgi:hypothetical protein
MKVDELIELGGFGCFGEDHDKEDSVMLVILGAFSP